MIEALESKSVILKGGEHILDRKALHQAETNTNWGSHYYSTGLRKPIESGKQIFLLKKIPGNQHLFDTPNCFIPEEEIFLFDNYEKAMEYTTTLTRAVSVWQYSESKFELIHHYVKG